MARNLSTVQFEVDFGNERQAAFQVQGAKYFYGDKNITDEIGCTILGDGEIVPGANNAKVSYQRYLPRLVAVMGKDGAAGAGNAAQSSNTRSFEFYCNPDNVGEAFRKLPGKDVDANLLPGDWKILRVYIPIDSNLR